MTTLPLSSRIEAFLFSEGGSLTRKRLMQLLSVSDTDLQSGIDELHKSLDGRGVTLIVTATEVSLVLSQESSKEVSDAFERELGAEVGEAALEVISIILYKGPSTRAQIDYIRGVNSTSTIRTLVARGLIERTGNPEDAREYLYRPTTELLSHLGVTDLKELPDYDKISTELVRFLTEAPKDHGNAANNSNNGEGLA